MTAKAHPIGPYSRQLRSRKVDGRTAIGRHIREFENQLVAHTGGAPAFPIRALIDQAVGIELQIVLLEERGITNDHDRRTYGALLGAKRLTLREIGLKPVAPPVPTIAEHMARKAAEKAAAAQAGGAAA